MASTLETVVPPPQSAIPVDVPPVDDVAAHLRSSPRRANRLQEYIVTITGARDVSLVLTDKVPTANVSPHPAGGLLVQITTRPLPQPATDWDREPYDYSAQHGLALHESGHVLYSEFEPWGNVKQDCIESDATGVKELADSLFNYLEDGAIEHFIRVDFSEEAAKRLEILSRNLSEHQFTGGSTQRKQNVQIGDALKMAVSDICVADSTITRKLFDPANTDWQFVSSAHRQLCKRFLPLIKKTHGEACQERNATARYALYATLWEAIETTLFDDTAQRAQPNQTGTAGQSEAGTTSANNDSGHSDQSNTSGQSSGAGQPPLSVSGDGNASNTSSEGGPSTSQPDTDTQGQADNGPTDKATSQSPRQSTDQSTTPEVSGSEESPTDESTVQPPSTADLDVDISLDDTTTDEAFGGAGPSDLENAESWDQPLTVETRTDIPQRDADSTTEPANDSDKTDPKTQPSVSGPSDDSDGSLGDDGSPSSASSTTAQSSDSTTDSANTAIEDPTREDSPEPDVAGEATPSVDSADEDTTTSESDESTTATADGADSKAKDMDPSSSIAQESASNGADADANSSSTQSATEDDETAIDGETTSTSSASENQATLSEFSDDKAEADPSDKSYDESSSEFSPSNEEASEDVQKAPPNDTDSIEPTSSSNGDSNAGQSSGESSDSTTADHSSSQASQTRSDSTPRAASRQGAGPSSEPSGEQLPETDTPEGAASRPSPANTRPEIDDSEFAAVEAQNVGPERAKAEQLAAREDTTRDQLAQQMADVTADVDLLPSAEGQFNAVQWETDIKAGERYTSYIKQFLDNPRRSRKRRGIAAGRPDSGLLHNTITGDPRRCSQRVTGDEHDLRFALILDKSASMSWNSSGGDPPVKIAESSTIQLAKALEECDIEVSILDFYGGTIRILKPFELDVHEARYRLATNQTSGGTPLGDALETATELLNQYPEPGHVIALTDDQPSNEQRYRSVLRDCPYPVHGVLLNFDSGTSTTSQSVEGFYNNSISVGSKGELQRALLRLIEGFQNT